MSHFPQSDDSGLTLDTLCVHGTQTASKCECDKGWITDQAQDWMTGSVVECNLTDFTYLNNYREGERPVNLAPNYIAELAVAGGLLLLLLALLIRRYVFPPAKPSGPGPLSEGQKLCLARCRAYLDTVRSREPSAALTQIYNQPAEVAEVP